MRKLNTADVFTAARAVKRSGLREELKNYVAQLAQKGELDVQDVGLDGMLKIIEVFSEKQAEQAIYETLACPFEMSAEDVASLPLGELCEKLEYLSQDDGILRFFKLLSGILSRS